jgi:hypothetical protein
MVDGGEAWEASKILRGPIRPRLLGVHGMDIEVQAIELTGKQLQALPKNERVFLVQAAHLANTIMILQKWLLFTEVRSPSQSVEAAAETTQQMLVMRLLCGVAHEGWKVLEKSYFGTQLSKNYNSCLSEEGRKHLKTLKCYFKGRVNLIKRVRNGFAFHFDRSAVEAELRLVPLDAQYHLYLSELQGNSLYYLSEELVGFAMLHGLRDVTDATEIPEMLDCLVKDLIAICQAFSGFIGACLPLIVRECLPTLTWDDLVQIDVSDVPALGQIRIPFFVAKPDSDAP